MTLHLAGKTVMQGGNISVQVPQNIVVSDGILAVDYPPAVTDYWQATVNAIPWMGGGAGTWLCSSVTSDPRCVGTNPSRWKFHFEFQRKLDGWQPVVFFSDPDTGKPPSDLVMNTGIKQVEWYPSRIFQELFPVMPATITAITKVSGAGWQYTWTGGTAPYRLVKDGLPYRERYDLTDIILNGTDTGEPPVLEVLDATETQSVTELFPPYDLLQWRGNTVAVKYRVDQYVGAAWVELGIVKESGLGYYQYPTVVQADGATATYRVVAVDSEGNESDAAQLSRFTIRHPDPPRIAMTYAAGNVTVAARA